MFQLPFLLSNGMLAGSLCFREFHDRETAHKISGITYSERKELDISNYMSLCLSGCSQELSTNHVCRHCPFHS